MTTNELKLSAVSVVMLNALNKIEMTFEEGVVARDREHMKFIALSDYDLPQLSTTVDFMEFKGLLVAIANKEKALVGTMFKKVEKGFLKMRLDMRTWNEMERIA